MVGRVRAKKARASARPKDATTSTGTDPDHQLASAIADQILGSGVTTVESAREELGDFAIENLDAAARTSNPFPPGVFEVAGEHVVAIAEPLQKSEQPIRFRDRILELRRVPASTLQDNAKNWRRHPDEQVSAMTSMLERIGFTGAIIAREHEGQLEVLDGHLRKGIAGSEVVPVLIVDLNDQEAALMLATYDPLSDLALMDAKALRDLLLESEVEDEDAFLRKLLADVSEDLAAEMQTQTNKPKEVEGMALEPHEHYDYLVVACQSSHEWNVLCDRLGLKPEARRAKMGTSRAIRATRLLEKLNAKV